MAVAATEDRSIPELAEGEKMHFTLEKESARGTIVLASLISQGRRMLRVPKLRAWYRGS